MQKYLKMSSDHFTEVYIALALRHSQLFPSSIAFSQEKSSMANSPDNITLGTGSTVKRTPIYSYSNKPLDPALLYSVKLLVCTVSIDSKSSRPLHCTASSWSSPVNLNTTLVSSSAAPAHQFPNSHSNTAGGRAGASVPATSGPSTFTTTTVVVILGLVIVSILIMLVIVYLRRRRHNNKNKLGVGVYGTNNTRLSKDKSMCLDQMLKEPLVGMGTGADGISASGSLRFTHNHLRPPLPSSSQQQQHFLPHANMHLDNSQLQLSSTPDLLVRSSAQPSSDPFLMLHEKLNKISKYQDRNGPIPVDILAEHVARLKENECALFSQEYESIEPGQQFTWVASSAEANRAKNRYANVVAYDHSRVFLQSSSSTMTPTAGPGANVKRQNGSTVVQCDYINANFIDGYRRPRAYIATQGPLAETIGDFWRMVWEQNSRVIVMMTRLEERDRAKCDQYWPLGGRGATATYSYVGVTLLEVVELAYYTIRRFNIQATFTGGTVSEQREVRQLQFTAWPDHGVPSHPAPLLMFLRRVAAESPNPPLLGSGQLPSPTVTMGPAVVHCSAGVGRTGAFIVVDHMLERLQYEVSVDVHDCVAKMRCQRNYMVQTQEQYVFVHELLLEAVQSGNTEVPVTALANHVDSLEALSVPPLLLPSLRDDGAVTEDSDGVHLTGLQLEFEKLLTTSAGLQQQQQQQQSMRLHSHCSTPSTSYMSPSAASAAAAAAATAVNYAPLTYETANLPVNQMKNRIIQILPPDFSRVSLTPQRGIEGSDYINASWIDGYRSRRAYIAAQGPLEDTVADFWRMLWEHSSSIIVMLTPLRESNRDRCSQYWPGQRSLQLPSHGLVVEPVAEYDMSSYVLREFAVTGHSTMTGQSERRVMRQFQYTDWRPQVEGLPQSTLALLDLVHQVHKTRLGLGHSGPITVHCSAGTARTGIFIVLSNVIERMRHESVADVFQTVKLLRWQRPALLQTEDQYQYCYTAALDYLRMYEQLNYCD